jgi:hypothetical protein
MSGFLEKPTARRVPGDVFDDLREEQQRLEAVLWTLPQSAWTAPSGAAGRSVVDVVLHLAQCEETVVATIAGPDALDVWNPGDATLDVGRADQPHWNSYAPMPLDRRHPAPLHVPAARACRCRRS